MDNRIKVLMVEPGKHPRVGHANVSITLNTYTHVLPEMDQEAADKLNNALFPSAQPISSSPIII